MQYASAQIQPLDRYPTPLDGGPPCPIDVAHLGMDVHGPNEVHIFVAPLNPSPADVERFREACAAWTVPDVLRQVSSRPTMKSLHLKLDFEDLQGHKNFAGVLQSSYYVTDGCLEEAKQVCTAQAAHLETYGFSIIRRKIEATATNRQVTGKVGIPQNNREAAAIVDAWRLLVAQDKGQGISGEPYFEFHIKIEAFDGSFIDNDEVVALRQISDDLAAKFAIRVPLSFNSLHEGQRFLNGRTYRMGHQETQAIIGAIKAAVNATGGLRVDKVISEYILADDNKAVDTGWLERP